LPRYAKYLTEYEETQIPTPPPRWGPFLKMASIILGMLCVNTSIYLIASLILAPPAPYHDQSVFAAEVTWVIFGLLPGLGAFICRGMYAASKSPQG
jgi:hypothetical protein